MNDTEETCSIRTWLYKAWYLETSCMCPTCRQQCCTLDSSVAACLPSAACK